MYNKQEQELERKQCNDSCKRVDEVEFESVRFIVKFVDNDVLLVNSRKELKEIVSLKEAEIEQIYTLTDKTDRYVDLETQNRYKVGVNKCVDDQWYCSNIDKQYTIYVMAKSKSDAVELAKRYAEERYSEGNDYFEPVWIETYHERERGWSHESFIK